MSRFDLGSRELGVKLGQGGQKRISFDAPWRAEHNGTARDSVALFCGMFPAGEHRDRKRSVDQLDKVFKPTAAMKFTGGLL